MKKNIEKEYKILVTKKQFELLLARYPNAQFQKQVNTYYDSEDRMIQHHHGAMRIREVQNQFLFTLKMHTDRGLMEYEMFVAQNDVSVFDTTEIKNLLLSFGFTKPIVPLTTLTTYRAMIDTGNAELCFDYSEYGTQKDYEIEYEYKKEHDGRTAFNHILAHANLKYEKNCISKIQRALNALDL